MFGETFEGIKKFGNDIISSSIKTTASLFGQIPIAFKVVHSALFDPPARHLALRIGRVVLHDMVIGTIVDYLLQHFQDYHEKKLDESKQYLFLLVYMSLKLGFNLVDFAIWLYQKDRGLKKDIRIFLLTLEFYEYIKNEKTRTKNTNVCEIEGCSDEISLEKSGQELFSYHAINYFISFLEVIPIIGKGSAFMLGIYHRGRFFFISGFPKRFCSKHLSICATQKIEDNLALGGGHVLTSYFITQQIQKYTFIPESFYQAYVTQGMDFIYLGIVANTPLTPLIEGQEHSIDPIANLEKLTEIVFATILFFLVRLKGLFNDGEASYTLGDLLTIIKAIPNHPLFTHPIFTAVQPLINKLKPLLNKSKSLILHESFFRDDPIVKPHQELLCNILIKIISFIEWTKISRTAAVASICPNASSRIIKFSFNLPTQVTNFLLAYVVNDSKIMALLFNFREMLEAKKIKKVAPRTNTALPYIRDDSAISIVEYREGEHQHQPSPEEAIKPINEKEEAKTPMLDPSAVIAPLDCGSKALQSVTKRNGPSALQKNSFLKPSIKIVEEYVPQCGPKKLV